MYPSHKRATAKIYTVTGRTVDDKPQLSLPVTITGGRIRRTVKLEKGQQTVTSTQQLRVDASVVVTVGAKVELPEGTFTVLEIGYPLTLSGATSSKLLYLG